MPKVAAPDGREEGIRRIDLPDEISPVHYVAIWSELKPNVELVIDNYAGAMNEIRSCEVPDFY